jgi:hypothetical protein
MVRKFKAGLLPKNILYMIEVKILMPPLFYFDNWDQNRLLILSTQFKLFWAHVFLMSSFSVQKWSPHMILKGSKISALQLKGISKSRMSMENFQRSIKLIFKLCMICMVHASSTMNNEEKTAWCQSRWVKMWKRLTGNFY